MLHAHVRRNIPSSSILINKSEKHGYYVMQRGERQLPTKLWSVSYPHFFGVATIFVILGITYFGKLSVQNAKISVSF